MIAEIMNDIMGISLSRISVLRRKSVRDTPDEMRVEAKENFRAKMSISHFDKINIDVY